MYSVNHSAPLSFSARSALAAFRVTHNINRLRDALRPADLSAVNDRGETLRDIAARLGDRRMLEAITACGGLMTVH
jgi:hypothetical protein